MFLPPPLSNHYNIHHHHHNPHHHRHHHQAQATRVALSLSNTPADLPSPRFSGRFHRRSIRRGSKYKMTHRSPTELSKVKKVRRAKANDRERTRMQTLNTALGELIGCCLFLIDCFSIAFVH